MEPEYILPFDDPGADLEMVGGKGASLSRMVIAGLLVPEGYFVTTEAYRCFVRENALQPHILKALEAVDISRPETLESGACSGVSSLPFLSLGLGGASSPESFDSFSKAYSAETTRLVPLIS